MADETDLITPPVTPSTNAPPLATLSAAALAQLALGFYFLFGGLLVLLGALTDSLVVPALRPLSVILIGAAALGMATGAWRLHRVTGLGEAWRKRTRDLLAATMLVAYLSLFFIMWREIPTNGYLLAHALAFVAMMLVSLCLLCLPVMVLARAADRPGLAVQAGAFGTVAVVLLVPPFGLIALRLVEARQVGFDPFSFLRHWVEHTPIWLTMIFLVPFSLTLSLLWSAKDLALEHLNARPE